VGSDAHPPPRTIPGCSSRPDSGPRDDVMMMGPYVCAATMWNVRYVVACGLVSLVWSCAVYARLRRHATWRTTPCCFSPLVVLSSEHPASYAIVPWELGSPRGKTPVHRGAMTRASATDLNGARPRPRPNFAAGEGGGGGITGSGVQWLGKVPGPCASAAAAHSSRLPAMTTRRGRSQEHIPVTVL